MVNDNLLDCDGIIIAFDDKKILITAQKLGEDDFDFIYYDFPQEYDCRKIISSPDDPLQFIRREEEENSYRVLRFQIGDRPILVTAYETEWLKVGISHWDINGDRLEFENNNLLNDQPVD